MLGFLHQLRAGSRATRGAVLIDHHGAISRPLQLIVPWLCYQRESKQWQPPALSKNTQRAKAKSHACDCPSCGADVWCTLFISGRLNEYQHHCMQTPTAMLNPGVSHSPSCLASRPIFKKSSGSRCNAANLVKHPFKGIANGKCEVSYFEHFPGAQSMLCPGRRINVGARPFFSFY